MNPNGSAQARGQRMWSVIAASSAGTVIEWDDFYIFGALASDIAPLFSPAAER